VVYIGGSGMRWIARRQRQRGGNIDLEQYKNYMSDLGTKQKKRIKQHLNKKKIKNHLINIGCELGGIMKKPKKTKVTQKGVGFGVGTRHSGQKTPRNSIPKVYMYQ
jgi:hypothetical protein